MILNPIIRAVTVAGVTYYLMKSGKKADDKPLPGLLDATLDELRAGLDNGDFSSVDLVAAYIGRIGDVNGKLRAVMEINPWAEEVAMARDEERRRDKECRRRMECRRDKALSPLHGIPVLVKDTIGTDGGGDGLNTTAGSYALRGARAVGDSTVVARLRRAGAIVLGKANLSQWANSRSGNSSHGWSALGGQTVGAYYEAQDPFGSSSGSAVAVSVGLAWAALGTDTAGSILSPAQMNNVVGLKPTVGLTSRHLVVPYSERMDSVGPLARTVKDAAYLLAAIAGEDPNDNYTAAIPYAKSPDGVAALPDYVAACRLDGLKGKRIGVPRNIINLAYDSSAGPSIDKFEKALDGLRDAGATIVEVQLPGGKRFFEKVNVWLGGLLGADLADGLARRYLPHLKKNPNNIRSLADLRNFTRHEPREDYPRRDTREWDEILEGGLNNTSPVFWERYQTMLHLAGPLGLTGAMRNYSLDAIVTPSEFSYFLSAVLGTPTITVPWGQDPGNKPLKRNGFGNLNEEGPGRPFGLAFTGPKWSEPALIGMAYAFEQQTESRKAIKPRIQPKTELKDIVVNNVGFWLS